MSILVCRHTPSDGLGHFDALFRAAGVDIAYQAMDRDARVRSLRDYQGLILMGGAMNVYQEREYPFLKTDLEYIEAALRLNLPILGFCLGAQLCARFLGASVTKNPQPELGWYELWRQEKSPLLAGFPERFRVFQWHEDTFSIPPGGRRLIQSADCPNQAFAYGDRLFGLQFHLEVTSEMIAEWLADQEAVTAWGFEAATVAWDTALYGAESFRLAQILAANFIRLLPERAPSGQ